MTTLFAIHADRPGAIARLLRPKEAVPWRPLHYPSQVNALFEEAAMAREMRHL